MGSSYVLVLRVASQDFQSPGTMSRVVSINGNVKVSASALEFLAGEFVKNILPKAIIHLQLFSKALHAVSATSRAAIVYFVLVFLTFIIILLN